MLAPKQHKTTTFSDGRLRGLILDDNNDKIIKDNGFDIPCGLPTVGFRRFYEAARTEGLRVDLVATIPWQPAPFDFELVELDRNDYPAKAVYKIVQIQEVKAAAPPCLQLTLQKEKVEHEDTRNRN